MVTEMPQERIWSRLAIALPVLFASVIYLFSTTNRGVIDYDEGYYSQVALHMVKHDDWVTPYANGVRFLEKPPLMYWVTAASLKTFGVNEFALRLPTALAVIAVVWLVALMARRGAGDRAAIIAGLCMASAVGTFLFTREALHDIWLVLFVTLAMYAFLEWLWDPGHSLRYALLFYSALAGAFMCKSLVGVAFPLGIVLIFFLLTRRWPKWRALYVLPGTVLFMVLSVPWHWLAAIRNRGFFYFFFVGEQFLRFLNKRDPPVLWSVPLFTFWALVLVWFFPWTAFLPAALSAKNESRDSNRRTLAILALTWAGVILVFFSLSARLEHYVFPALPALSLLAGSALSRIDDSKSLKWAFRGLAILGVVILVAGIGSGIWFVIRGQGLGSAGAGLTGRIYETDFSILADLPADIMRNLLKPAALTILALPVGFCVSLWFETRRRRMQAVFSLALVMMFVCGMIHWSLNICGDLISSKRFALAVAQEAQPGDHLVVVGDYESANSISFYQPLNVEVFEGVAYALIPGMKFPDAPRIVLSRNELESMWWSQSRVFAIVPKSRAGELGLSGTWILEVLDRVLIRNH